MLGLSTLPAVEDDVFFGACLEERHFVMFPHGAGFPSSRCSPLVSVSAPTQQLFDEEKDYLSQFTLQRREDSQG